MHSLVLGLWAVPRFAKLGPFINLGRDWVAHFDDLYMGMMGAARGRCRCEMVVRDTVWYVVRHISGVPQKNSHVFGRAGLRSDTSRHRVTGLDDPVAGLLAAPHCRKATEKGRIRESVYRPRLLTWRSPLPSALTCLD